MKTIRILLCCILTGAIFIFGIKPALAFCGFYVAKADSSLYNQASQVIIARDGNRTVPIRLGMSNAKGEQDLIVYLLSPDGQVELTNYRTIKVPSNVEIPKFIKGEFGNFYQAMFTKTYQQENKQAAVLEYAWDMNWCDPCAADPLNQEELKQAGVFWLDREVNVTWLDRLLNKKPHPNNKSVFITRLHIRYTRDKFPEDLVFQSTNNHQSFQGRYIIRHPYTKEIGITCKDWVQEPEKKEQWLNIATKDYQNRLAKKQDQEIQNLANLTGWNIEDIRNKITSIEP